MSILTATIEQADTIIDVTFPSIITMPRPAEIGRVSSLLMLCEEDGTNHRVRIRKKNGKYVSSVNQAHEAGNAIASLAMPCLDDETTHLVVVQKRGTAYVLSVDQKLFTP